MVNRDFDKYTAEEYNRAYDAIRYMVTACAIPQTEKRAYILGGAPGVGKSKFYAGNESLVGYATIDGDIYRKFHPRYSEIAEHDFKNYANITQSFVNRVVEQLIDDLSSRGYGLIVEGTLRSPSVPIKTCELLKNKGYETKLVVIACDAEQSWKSTIKRAELMKAMGERPRLVPINKYNTIINSLPRSLDAVVGKDCFDSVNVISRDNEVLYKNGDEKKPYEIMRDILDVDKWNERYLSHVQEYTKKRAEILGKESRETHEQEYIPCAHEEVRSRG